MMTQKQKKIVSDRWQTIADVMSKRKLDLVLICASQQDFGFGSALGGMKPIMYHYLTLDKKNRKLVRGYFVPSFLVARLGLSNKKNVVIFDDKQIPNEFGKFLNGHRRVGILGPAPAVHFSKTSSDLVFLDDYMWPLLNKKDKSEIAEIEITSGYLKKVLRKAEHLLVQGSKLEDTADILDRELLKSVDSLAFPTLVESLLGNRSLLGMLGEKTYIKKKDIIFVNIGAEVDGYFADAGRTFVINNPELKKKVGKIEKGFVKFVENLKPGMNLTGLPRMLQSQLDDSGLKKVKLDKSYIGHSVGFNIINMPFIGEAIFRKEKLLANTTLSFFIDTVVDGQQFILQDTVLIGVKKNKILTR